MTRRPVRRFSKLWIRNTRNSAFDRRFALNSRLGLFEERFDLKSVFPRRAFEPRRVGSATNEGRFRRRGHSRRTRERTVRDWRDASEVYNLRVSNKTTLENSRAALRTVETSSYTYFHVLRRFPSACKLLKVLVSWPLTRWVWGPCPPRAYPRRTHIRSVKLSDLATPKPEFPHCSRFCSRCES